MNAGVPLASLWNRPSSVTMPTASADGGNMSLPALLRAVALLMAVVLTSCGCTVFAAGDTVSASGGEVSLPDDPRVALIVPPGAAPEPTRVTLSLNEQAPAPNPGTIALGDAVDIRPSAPLPGAIVRLPIDAAQVGVNQDFSISIYSESLHLWVPLPTEWDGAGFATATAPHFSRFQVFGFDVGDATAGAARGVGNAVHDAYGGVKNFAGGIVDGLDSWWEGGEQEELNCGGEIDSWTVSSEASETTGCVVDNSGSPDLRLRSSFRVPFSIAGPTAMDFELSDGDFELSLMEFVTRRLNASAGLGSLGSRGTTSAGLPSNLQEEGSTVPVLLVPDQLATAWGVIDSLLSFLPNKKKVTEQVDRVVLTTIWEQRGSAVSVTSLLEATRTAVERTATDSESLDALKHLISAWKCATESLEAGGTTAQERDPNSTAEEVVEVVKECTGDVLKAADSAMSEVWSTVTGSLDGVQALRQTADLIKLGFTQWAGEISMSAEREGLIVLGRRTSTFSSGFGDSRPAVIDLGGASSTGRIDSISWESWGGERAQGSGLGLWVAPTARNADGQREAATVIAFDPGDCEGERVYRQVVWFFPQYGETFESAYPLDACAGY